MDFSSHLRILQMEHLSMTILLTNDLICRVIAQALIGERERANLVVRSVRSVGRAHTVHMRMRGIYVKRLRGMCPFERNRRLDRRHETGEEWQTRVSNAELEIHVLRRRKRLPTEIAEERETRLPRRCARISHACIFSVL